MKEIWKDVVGFEGLYQVSNYGRIFGVMSQKLKSSYLDKDGYNRVTFSKNSLRKKTMVHRVVAIAFIDNPMNKPTVNHIDGIKTNNRVDNLEWMTYKEQAAHSYNSGLTKILTGEDSPGAKLTQENVDDIKNLLVESSLTQKDIASKFDISPSVISSIKKGNSWDRSSIERTSLHPSCGSSNPQSKLTESDVVSIKLRLSKGVSRKELMKEYDVSKNCIHLIATGESWSHVTVPDYIYEKVRNGNAKLDEEKVREIHIKRKQGHSQKMLWEEYGVSRTTIQNILKGKVWVDIYEEMK